MAHVKITSRLSLLLAVLLAASLVCTTTARPLSIRLLKEKEQPKAQPGDEDTAVISIAEGEEAAKRDSSGNIRSQDPKWWLKFSMPTEWPSASSKQTEGTATATVAASSTATVTATAVTASTVATASATVVDTESGSKQIWPPKKVTVFAARVNGTHTAEKVWPPTNVTVFQAKTQKPGTH